MERVFVSQLSHTLTAFVADVLYPCHKPQETFLLVLYPIPLFLGPRNLSISGFSAYDFGVVCANYQNLQTRFCSSVLRLCTKTTGRFCSGCFANTKNRFSGDVRRQKLLHILWWCVWCVRMLRAWFCSGVAIARNHFCSGVLPIRKAGFLVMYYLAKSCFATMGARCFHAHVSPWEARVNPRETHRN